MVRDGAAAASSGEPCRNALLGGRMELGPLVRADAERRVARFGRNVGGGTIFAAMGFGGVSQSVAREMSGVPSQLEMMQLEQLSAESVYGDDIFPSSDEPFDDEVAQRLEELYSVSWKDKKFGKTTAVDRLARALAAKEISSLWDPELVDQVSPLDVDFILACWNDGERCVPPQLAWAVVRKLWTAASPEQAEMDALAPQVAGLGGYVHECEEYAKFFASGVQRHDKALAARIRELASILYEIAFLRGHLDDVRKSPYNSASERAQMLCRVFSGNRAVVKVCLDWASTHSYDPPKDFLLGAALVKGMCAVAELARKSESEWASDRSDGPSRLSATYLPAVDSLLVEEFDRLKRELFSALDQGLARLEQGKLEEPNSTLCSSAAA